jgi:hypothetical protein
MSKLSTLQIATLQAFRKTHAGPIGIILEDGQGYWPLISNLANVQLCESELDNLERRRVIKCVNGGGNGPLERVELRDAMRLYNWCFVLFQTTFGRDDVAEQIDQLLGEGKQTGRLILVNYHLDQLDAEDDLRRLFAMIPTVQLYFADGLHLFEIDSDDTVNALGARQVADFFAMLRKAELPPLTISYREVWRSVEELGAGVGSKAVVNAVRKRFIEATEALFRVRVRFLPPKQEFWARFDEVAKAFMAASA